MLPLSKISSVLTLVMFVLMLSSCREKIELTLPSTYTRLVVEGAITDNSDAHTIKLTLTDEFFSDGEPTPATGATVTISDGTQTIYLSETSPGIYQTLPYVQGVPGRSYHLTIKDLDVDNDGQNEVYTATDLMKPSWLLDSVEVIWQNPGETPRLYKVNGWGLEPATPDNCYQWVYSLNGKLLTDTLKETIFIDDTYFNGSYLPGLTMFDDIAAMPGDTLMVETRSLSREYYNFLTTLMLETVWNQGGAAGPPANIISNISHGALGYFSAYSVTRRSVVIP